MTGRPPPATDWGLTGPRDRLLDDAIVGLVAPGERVVDLGCGRGDLLLRLRAERGVREQGVERDGEAAAACVARGLSVVQGDLVEELSSCGDGAFDTAILNQVLTLVRDPLGVIEEALRAARRAVVTFPNFTHWKVRLQLLLTGRLPVTASLPYQWHDTPHIRYVGVAGFRRACRGKGWVVEEERFVRGDGAGDCRPVRSLPNLRASLALFVVRSAAEGKGPGPAPPEGGRARPARELSR